MSGFAQGLVAGIAALLLTIQFIRPAKTNPPIVRERTLEAAVAVPPEVEAILARSCDDCHSNRTEWPWYSDIAPVSFVVVNHVNEGRRHLNFSEWLPPGAGDPAAYTFERLHNVCKSVQSDSMPLKSYTFIHRQATLSEQDIERLCDWSQNRLSGPGSANLR
jgi:hypothetical protein